MDEIYNWDAVRASFTPAEQVDQADPELMADDVPLSEWGQHRAELGITDSGELAGIGSWQRPVRYIPDQLAPMSEYIEERKANHIPDTCDLAGATPPRPRRNKSPYSI